MREGAVTDVVEQACCRNMGMIIRRERQAGSKSIEKMHSAKGMLKPGMMCARVNKV